MNDSHIDLIIHLLSGEYTSDHETIILFWKVVYQFNGTQRKQLLKFVTSCSRPPLLGFKASIPHHYLLLLIMTLQPLNINLLK